MQALSGYEMAILAITVLFVIDEGLNNKLKRITRKSYGFRTQKAYETALYHNLGDLPEPEFTHRFF